MKKTLRRTLAMLVCLLLIAGTFSTAFAGTLNGGKSYGKAVKLPRLGTSYVGKLTANRRTMWYKFKTLSTDAFYTVTVKNLSVPDHIEVYYMDANEEELKRETWLSQNNQLSVNLKLARNKMYYIKIVATSTKAGNVKTTVSARKDAIGDTRGKAKALTWKKTVTGTIDGNGDSDFFKFKAPKTRVYTITVKNASCNEHIEAYITDKYEEELARETWISKNNQLNKEIKLKKGQMYYIQVVGSTGTGNYKVTIK